MNRKCIVIGSGLAGTLIANSLSEEFQVTVLERGDRSKTSYPAVNFVQKKLAAVYTFCHGSGGTTNLWHNGLIPIRPMDIWDPMFRQLLIDSSQFRDEAASALHFPNSAYSHEFENLLTEASALGEEIGSFPDGIDCLIYPKQFEPLKLKPAVHAFYNVDPIDFRSAGNRITTVKFSSGRESHSIDADVVVVSAGSFGTPRVLGNIFLAMGEDESNYESKFIDHPMGFVGKCKFPKRISRAVRNFAFLDKGGYVSNNIIRLKSECGNYSAGAYFRPALTMDNREAIYKYKSLLGGSSGMQRLRNACSPKLFHPDIIAEIVMRLFKVQVPTRIFSVLFFGEQKSRRNRVSYEGDRLNVDWSISEEELNIYRKMLERFVGMLSDVAEEIIIETDLSPDWLWSGAHHSGTTLMGDEPGAVIDTELRLKCSKNVFVCDGSVIQEHSYANTGLTIGELALRLAGHLKQEMPTYPFK